jgi:hypothetical protein
MGASGGRAAGETVELRLERSLAGEVPVLAIADRPWLRVRAPVRVELLDGRATAAGYAAATEDRDGWTARVLVRCPTAPRSRWRIDGPSGRTRP